jgi:hypothetical protein
MSKKEVNWLINTQGIRTIVTIKEEPLSQEWLGHNNGQTLVVAAQRLIICI